MYTKTRGKSFTRKRNLLAYRFHHANGKKTKQKKNHTATLISIQAYTHTHTRRVGTFTVEATYQHVIPQRSVFLGTWSYLTEKFSFLLLREWNKSWVLVQLTIIDLSLMVNRAWRKALDLSMIVLNRWVTGTIWCVKILHYLNSNGRKQAYCEPYRNIWQSHRFVNTLKVWRWL